VERGTKEREDCGFLTLLLGGEKPSCCESGEKENPSRGGEKGRVTHRRKGLLGCAGGTWDLRQKRRCGHEENKYFRPAFSMHVAQARRKIATWGMT